GEGGLVGGASRSKRLAHAVVVCARGSMRVSELAAGEDALARLTGDNLELTRNKKTASKERGGLFVRVGLFARRAPTLGSTRRRGFLPADRHHADFGCRLELGRRGRDHAWLLVNEALALVVPENHFVVVHGFKVLRQERHFSAATGGVDHELRHCQTRSPPP